MSFIVNPESVSFTEIKQDLQTYLDGLPDSAKWRDFFASSTGQIVLDTLAGLGTFLSYNIVTARRETFLQYSQNRSSIVAGAQTLGYSAFRGRNAILELTIIPNFTGLLSKYTSLGTVKDQDLILLEDTVFNDSTTQTVKVLVGSLKTEVLQAPNDAPNAFRFTQKNVSQDLRVKLNNVEVPSSEKVLDMINQKYATISNVLGSVDVLYLNTIGYQNRYFAGDQITLEWVELKDTTFTAADLKFDYGILTQFVVDSSYQAPESNDSIKINAPLFNETQFIIRGRDDYSKVFRLLNSTIHTTDYTDVSAAVVDLCYARIYACLFTSSELTAFINKLMTYRPMGLQPPTISQPTIVFLDLNISMVVLNSTGSPTTSSRTIMQGFERNLRQKVQLSSIEQQVEALSFVKVARVSIRSSVRDNNTIYRRGQHVKIASSPLLFEAVDFVYRAGAVEPAWPNLLDLTVEDGRIRWIAIALQNPAPPAWAANGRYKNGDIIRRLTGASTFHYQAQLMNKSGAATAGFQATGTFDSHTFTAVSTGSFMNGSVINFDGITDLATIVSDFILANPGKNLTYSGAGGDVLAFGSVTLTGGITAADGQPAWPGSLVPPC